MGINKGGTKTITRVFQGFAVGVITAAAALYGVNRTGQAGDASGFSPAEILNWCGENLGMSSLVFALVFVMYLYYLFKLKNVLAEKTPDPTRVISLADKTDLLISLFFAVGVIWTAIGMRNALLVSLGNMDADLAAEKGAFFILKKLVDGGMLVALSTTIFGGIGGYLMRGGRSWLTGESLTDFYEKERRDEHRAVTDRLDRIADLMNKAEES